ncbi:dipeptidyl aminopeptidase [Paenibacillus larvae]
MEALRHGPEDPVASYADAWIEMDNFRKVILVFNVASYADAWIEMDNFRKVILVFNVASYADAWIEIN